MARPKHPAHRIHGATPTSEQLVVSIREPTNERVGTATSGGVFFAVLFAVTILAAFLHILNVNSSNPTVVFRGTVDGAGRGLSSFTGIEGQLVSISAYSDGAASILRLLSSSGQEIARDDDADEINTRLVVTLPTDGPYVIELTALDGPENGSYEVTLDRMPPAELPELPWDQRTREALGADGYKFWSFLGEAGEVVSVEARSGDFGTALEMFAPTGQQIARDSGYGGRGARLAVVLPANGRYLVELSGVETLAAGTYELFLERMSPGDSGELVWSSPARGSLDENGRGTWSIAGTAGQLVSLEVEAEEFDVDVRVVAPSGDEVRTDSDGGADGQVTILALPESGQYLVEVMATSETARGIYEITATSEFAQLGVGEPDRGTLGAEGRGLWSFLGARRQLVSVEAESDDFDTVLRLISPAGEEVANDDDSGDGTNSRVLRMLPMQGQYLVQVRAFDGGTNGMYDITLEEHAISESIPLPWNETATRTMSDNRHDIWSFDGRGGQLVSVEAVSDERGLVMRLLAPSGEEIGTSSDGLTRILALPENGRYWVEVTGSETLTINTYEARVDSEFEELDRGESVYGTLRADERDVWGLVGVTDQPVIVDVMSDEFDTVLRIVTPTGEQVGYDDDGGQDTNSQIIMTLPSNGRHLVEIGAFGESEGGKYEVVLR